MTSPTEPIAPQATVGDERGDALGRGASLDPFLYQERRFCANCGGERVFVPVFECAIGRVGYCLGCEEQRVIRFTRATECAA